MSNIAEIVAAVRSFYREHCPAMLARASIASGSIGVVPATPVDLEALEATIGIEVPGELRELLSVADFAFCFENNFDALDAATIAAEWAGMTKLLRTGAFEGWVDSRQIDDNPGVSSQVIRRCWWHERWIPFAVDSAGNRKCIDLAPGPCGVRGQILAMESQDAIGPSATGINSLEEYMALQLRLLEAGLFTVSGGHLEIDRNVWRLRG